MNPLTSMFDQLAVSLTADPLLLLASAVAAFDPFWNVFDAEDIDYDTDPLHIALQVTRGAFPDIYAEAVERLRAGASYQEMDHLLCKAISAKGIPLDDLDVIGWGVPLNAIGVDLEDPEFYAVHTDLLPILAPFGIDVPEGEMYSVDVPECVYPAGRDLSLFALTDFVQMGETVEADDTPLIDEADNEDALTLEAPQHPVISSNGHNGTNGATEQSALL